MQSQVAAADLQTNRRPACATLAPYVGADLNIMHADTTRMRTTAKGLKPFVMTNLKTQTGLTEIITYIETQGMLLN